MKKKFSPHLDLTKSDWEKRIKPGDVVIDATCGNGYDTLFLAKIPGIRLFAVDIQPEAIEATKNLLIQHGIRDRVTLCCCSHETFDQLPLPASPQLIIYNLGYLPGKNKNFTTQTESTLKSLNEGLQILAKEGAISITCYPGHEEGMREEQAILSWAESLCPKRWVISHHRWVNRHRSPTVLSIESFL